MKQLIWAGLALQLCAGPVFAQSAPATTPSTPPVTTPPAPAVNQPTGGPNSPPIAEPANAIDTTGVAPGANSFTEAQARSRLRDNGYSQVSALKKDQNGIWRGSAEKSGTSVHVSVDYKGHIASN
jgi:periplasmic protein CpxP/Spy